MKGPHQHLTQHSFYFFPLQTLTPYPGYLYCSLSSHKPLHAVLICLLLLVHTASFSSKDNFSGKVSSTPKKIYYSLSYPTIIVYKPPPWHSSYCVIILDMHVSLSSSMQAMLIAMSVVS